MAKAARMASMNPAFDTVMMDEWTSIYPGIENAVLIDGDNLEHEAQDQDKEVEIQKTS